MPVLRAQATFSRTTGLPEDVVVNTFHFSVGLAPQAADLADILDQVTDFYLQNVPGTDNAPGSWLNSTIAREARIRVYNLDDPMPRPIVAQSTFNLPAAPPPPNLPGEVAAVISYSAEHVAGVSERSLRGRIYFGPFTSGLLVASGGDMRVGTTLRSDLANAAQRLARRGDDTLPGGATGIAPTWSVYSPTRRARGQNPFVFAVTRGFVDDAVDIQRRRGVDATTRNSWTR